MQRGFLGKAAEKQRRTGFTPAARLACAPSASEIIDAQVAAALSRLQLTTVEFLGVDADDAFLDQAAFLLNELARNVSSDIKAQLDLAMQHFATLEHQARETGNAPVAPASAAPSAAPSAAAPPSAAPEASKKWVQVVARKKPAASAQRQPAPTVVSSPPSAAPAQQPSPLPAPQQEAAQPQQQQQRAPQQRKRGCRAGKRVQARRTAAQRRPAQDGLATVLGSVERITAGLIRVAAGLASGSAAAAPAAQQRRPQRAAARRPTGPVGPPQAARQRPAEPAPAPPEVEEPSRGVKRPPEESPDATSDTSSQSGMSVSSPSGAA